MIETLEAAIAELKTKDNADSKTMRVIDQLRDLIREAQPQLSFKNLCDND
jgi:hypothetical protein